MDKNIINEIKNMKYFLDYKRGVVISEQTAADNVNQLINSLKNPSSQNNVYGGFDNKNIELQNAIKGLSNFFGGNINSTGTQTASTQTQTASTETQTASTENQTASTETTPATPIKIGVKNPSIEELQNFLNTNFQSNLVPDGKYGPKTSSSILVALQNKMKSTDETPASTETTAASTAAEKTAAANTSQPLASNTENNQQQPQAANNFSEVDLNSIIKVG